MTTEEYLEEQVEEEAERIGLKENALNRNKRRSASNCRRNGVNPTISAKRTTPDKN